MYCFTIVQYINPFYSHINIATYSTCIIYSTCSKVFDFNKLTAISMYLLYSQQRIYAKVKASENPILYE